MDIIRFSDLEKSSRCVMVALGDAKKNVIVNADDFGLAEHVNLAIIDAHRNGILTSTSLMANMAGFEHAVCLARKTPSLGVGVHLNLFRGRPLSNLKEVKLLVNPKTGLFFDSSYKWVTEHLFDRFPEEQVEVEFRNQIRRCLEQGLSLTHLDSEKHLHMLPRISKVVLNLASEYGIPAVRCVDESFFSGGLGINSLKNRNFYLFLFLKDLFKGSINKIRSSHLFSSDNFLGFINTGDISASGLSKLLSVVRPGVTEIMMHPGHSSQNAELLPDYSLRLQKMWEQEYQALIADEVKDMVRFQKINLINWREAFDLNNLSVKGLKNSK